MSDENFISRWSKKKIEARRQAAGERQEDRQQATGDRQEPTTPTLPLAAEPAPLPAVESLTPESDFSPFMRDGVDPGTRRLAVKKLFEDPRYNVMDGLDVYIDDYSKPDPLPEGWLEKMTQVARLGIFQPAPPPEETAAANSETAVLHVDKEGDEQLPPPVTSTDPANVSQVVQSPPDKV
ncbi:MAG TPA: DUF3306 domain-containing protein [Usitatibacter sp.]|nr:DUF3306 domain-containing protein [Usitatibacter sp.]